MSKDVLLVITDHRFGDSSASKWLEDYHAADFEKQGLNLGMLRSGRIRAGLVLDFYASSFDQLVLSPCLLLFFFFSSFFSFPTHSC